MTHGKNICNQLKEVRKRIAEENDIPLEIEECTYKGECRGTCPRCEAEVRYLENALADRLRLGKVATVAGLALGLATTTAQAQVSADSTLTQQADSAGHEKIRHLEYTPSLLSSDAPEAILSTERLRRGRPLAGEVIAEIQVILGGTPACYNGNEFGDHPRFYEEKKEDEVKVIVR